MIHNKLLGYYPLINKTKWYTKMYNQVLNLMC